MAQHLRVQLYPYSDHSAKMGCFHLVTGSGEDWRGRRFLRAARYSSKPQVDIDAIRGPSPEAQNLRAQLRSRMDRALQPLLPHIHFRPTENTVSVHLFVDGSSRSEDRFQGSNIAGCGDWIPEANLTFHGPEETLPDKGLWVGAEKQTNNTGELSAMVFALIWLWQSEYTGKPLSHMTARMQLHAGSMATTIQHTAGVSCAGMATAMPKQNGGRFQTCQITHWPDEKWCTWGGTSF